MSLALALALGLALAPGGDAGEILKSLEDSGRALKTMRASFVETKTILLLDEKQESTGEVFLQVPGRFRWNYATPQPSTMLIKDARFARYFPKSKQVFRGPAKGEADLLVGFGPGAAGLGKKYDVTLVGEEKVGALAAWVLDLKPRAGQSGLFSAIRLWVDQARSIPVQTRLTEPTGDFTLVRFDEVEINRPMPANAFELKLAKDVVEVQ